MLISRFIYRPPRHPTRSLSQISKPSTPSRANSHSLADSFNALSVSTPVAKPASSSSASSPSREKGRALPSPAVKPEPASPAPIAFQQDPVEQAVAIVQDGRDEEELVVVDEAKAEIYLFDVELEHFVLQGEVKITLIEKDAKTFDCKFTCPSWTRRSRAELDSVSQTGLPATLLNPSSGSSVNPSTRR